MAVHGPDHRKAIGEFGVDGAMQVQNVHLLSLRGGHEVLVTLYLRPVRQVVRLEGLAQVPHGVALVRLGLAQPADVRGNTASGAEPICVVADPHGVVEG